MPLKQDNRLIGLKTALGPDVLAVRSVTIHEEISRLFQIDGELSSENGEVDFDKVIGKPVTLEVSANGYLDPSYDWYSGRTGDVTIPLSSHSNQMTVTFYYAPADFQVWAEVWDHCNYATVEFTINVVTTSRRRATRH